MSTDKSVARILRKLVRALAPDTLIISAGSVALILGSLINLALPKIFGFLISQAGFELLTSSAFAVAGFLLLVFLAQALCFYFRSYYFGLAGHRYVKRARLVVFNKLLQQPLSYYQTQQTGDLVARLSGDLTILQDLITFKLSVLIRYSLQVMVASILMLIISWKLTLGLVLVLPILVVTSIFFGRKLKRLSSQVQGQVGQAMSLAQDALQDLRTIKAFNAQTFIFDRFSKLTDLILSTGDQRAKFSAFFQSFVNFLMNISLVCLLLYGVMLVYYARLEMSELVTFVMYSAIVAVSFAMAASSYSELSQASGSAERIFELTSDSSTTPPASTSTNKAAPLSQIELAITDLAFSYSKSNTPTLSNISFTLTPGKVTALVGPSGAGKSSLINLVLGLYQPDSGKIKLNNQDLTPEVIELLHKHTALVPQEPLLFNFSILDNLRLAKPDASTEEAWRALQQVNLESYVRSLPEQLEASCGERGGNLSSGQRQRLALARAILRDPLLLILDEANSALDSENEAIISDTLRPFFINRTVLIISHRFASIAKADNILVLENGHLVQSGTHCDLLNQIGLYQTLARLQNFTAMQT